MDGTDVPEVFGFGLPPGADSQTPEPVLCRQISTVADANSIRCGETFCSGNVVIAVGSRINRKIQ